MFVIQIVNSLKEDGYLVEDVMSWAPLWCIIHQTHGGVLSNSEIENHFLSVKRNSKTGSRPLMAAFVLDRYKCVKRRVARIVKL